MSQLKLSKNQFKTNLVKPPSCKTQLAKQRGSSCKGAQFLNLDFKENHCKLQDQTLDNIKIRTRLKTTIEIAKNLLVK
jgi:hypothetical protein